VTAVNPPDNGTDDPMPVFVIKAKDLLAMRAIEYYRRLCDQHGLCAQADEVYEALNEIAGWRQRHNDLVKLPDHKHVPVGETKAARDDH